MFAYEVRIRKAATLAIDADRPNYVFSDFDLKETYLPQESLEDLGNKPFVKVVSIGHSAERQRILRDTTKVLLSLPVQIAIQQRVNVEDTEYIDKLVLFAEQIRQTLEDDELVSGEDYQWQKTEPLQDPEGNTFSYQDLIQKGVFNVIFTAFYHYIKQP